MKTCTVEGCAKPHRARGLCAGHYNRRYRGDHWYRTENTECVYCGCQCAKRIDASRPRRYCSMTCRTAEQYKEIRASRPPQPGRELILRPGGRDVALTTRGRRALDRAQPKRSNWWQLFIAGSCASCGDYFLAPAASTDTAALYCSRKCQRFTGKLRRRVRLTGALVGPVSRRKVFERDRWTCKICGKRVKRRADAPDPKAPVLDHIVPLAAGPENGGVHASWNVQCAHFLCNSIKQAAWSQGALF